MSEKQEESPQQEKQDEVSDGEEFQDAVENEVKPDEPIVRQEESKMDEPATIEGQNLEENQEEIVESGPRINGFLGSQ
tara:strand:- start:270 stop:503 length:234 start_codon:yes stop_codon:yes gene_type:complete